MFSWETMKYRDRKSSIFYCFKPCEDGNKEFTMSSRAAVMFSSGCESPSRAVFEEININLRPTSLGGLKYKMFESLN